MMKLWLQERWLWWQTMLPILFAHKPLCDRFRKDILQIGHWYVCRSCVLLWISFFISLGMFVSFAGFFVEQKFLFTSFSLIVMIVSYPQLYQHYSREVRDVLRSLLGAAFSWGLLLLVEQQWLLAGSYFIVAVVLKKIFQAARKVIHRRACDGCAELAVKTKVCSGFELKAAKMRQYEQGLQHLLVKHHH